MTILGKQLHANATVLGLRTRRSSNVKLLEYRIKERIMDISIILYSFMCVP